MKIAILGSGNIGSTLGAKWARAGHAVTFGARNVIDPKYQALLETVGGNSAVASVPEAVRAADVVLLAIPGTAVEETVAGLGGALQGKIVIDATNRIQQPVMNSISAIAAAARDAKLFRAFSSLGWENFATPQLGGTQIDLFYCGVAGEAKDAVEQLIADVGLRPVYVGDVDQAALIDDMTRLWFALAMGQGYGRRIAFKLLAE
jgi:predicted dinucleotide-binding enzyme